MSTDAFERGLIEALPRLRSFALSLCKNPDRVDDLVQETSAKALASSDSFTEGTNLLAWLFTILRNVYYSEFRKRRREVEDIDGMLSGMLVSKANQYDHMAISDLRRVLEKIDPDQRNALVLVGAYGVSYESAAQECGSNVSTMKSRVLRARAIINELLPLEA